MTYNSTYAPGDMKNILLDIFAEGGHQVVLFMGLILAVVVFIFLISRFKR